MIGRPDELIRWLLEQDREKLFEVKRKRRKRSLTQNAYYWVMLNQLAAKLHMPDDELHMHMLRRYGVHDVMTMLEIINPADYFPYFDVIGHGVLEGKEYQHVRVMKRSSHMDSAEFSRLIEGMREECEIQEIPVMTKREISQLRFVEGKDGD